MSANDRKTAVVSNVISIVLSVVVGVVIGLSLMFYLPIPAKNPMQLVYLALCLFLSYFIVIFFHNLGHYYAARLVGYSFVSFRIGKIIFVHEDGRLIRKRYHLIGTGGQCLMMPPEEDEPDKHTLSLYLMGGGLFNLVCSLIFLPISFKITNFYLDFPFFLIGIFSLVGMWINMIPSNFLFPNDAYAVLQLRKDPVMRNMIYSQLRINGLLHLGFTPSEIPEKEYHFGDTDHGLVSLLRATVALDQRDFTKAQTLLQQALNSHSLFHMYALEARLELVFCKLMIGDPEQEITTMLDSELMNYANNSAKTQISKRRFLYTYYLVLKKDDVTAQKHYDAAMAMKKTYPCYGELRSELSLIAYVKSIYSHS